MSAGSFSDRSKGGVWWGHAWRTLVLALLWVGLGGADWRSWLVGAPAVALAAWAGARLAPKQSWRLSWPGVFRFFLFFLAASLRGGSDVARRAFRPRMQLNPGVVSYAMRLPAGVPRWLFCGVISLLPGTAVVDIGEQEISVHVLDIEPRAQGGLSVLEERVAAVFGADPTTAGGDR